MRSLRAAEPKLCVKLKYVCKMCIKRHVHEAECSRNVGFECHSESVGSLWVKPGHNRVKCGSKLGHVGHPGQAIWVRWVTWGLWATGLVKCVKRLLGLLNFVGKFFGPLACVIGV